MSLRPLLSALGLTAAAALGCASPTDESPTDESALSEPREFDFDVRSRLERAGELDERNSYWAARLAAISYEHDTDASLQTGLRAAGVPFEEAFVFHASEGDSKNPLARHSGTSGIYVRASGAGFLVFRGSEDGKTNDAITDAVALQVEARYSLTRASAGQVHLGFHTALDSVWKPLREELVRRHGDRRLPLYVMGHSLGGAIATLAVHQLLFDECLNSTMARIDVAGLCEQNYVPVAALYTFGSPRTGNQEFVEMMVARAKETGTKFFRFVNVGDQVSMLPRYAPVAVVEPFRHLGEAGDEKAFAVLLHKDGQVTFRPTVGCDADGRLAQCDLSLWTGLEGVAGGTPPWHVEHSRSIYLERLRATVMRAGTSPAK